MISLRVACCVQLLKRGERNRRRLRKNEFEIDFSLRSHASVPYTTERKYLDIG